MITLRPGEIFQGRYRLIDPLGEGAYSQVWRAIQITLSRPVVIKIMRENLVGKHPQLVKRFLQEAQILANINHRNIVRVLDADVVDGRPYFVMDFVEGRDLHHVLIGTPEYRLLPLEVADTMEAVLHGLIEAHGLGVIHLDLKPENVLVGDDGISRLIDFGIALMTEDGAPRQTRGTMGTPGYMAPEILSSRLTAGPTTDIFAAGVMLFVLCGGRLDLPEGQGIADLSRAEVRDGYLAMLRGEYVAFIKIIRRATTFEQESRYASADEMLGAISAARRTIERAQPVPQGSARPNARRSTPPVAAFLSAALAAEEEAATGRAPTAVPAPAVAPGQSGSRLVDAPPTRASDDAFLTRDYVPPSFPWKYVVVPVVFLGAAFIAWLVWPSDEVTELAAATPVADEQPVVDPGEATMEPVLSTPTPSGSETPPILPAGGEETASEPPAVPIAKIDPPSAPVVKTAVKPVAAPVEVPVLPETPPNLPAGGEEITKPPPVPVVVAVTFSHTPVSTCAAAGRIEAHGPPGSVVKMRYRPSFDPAIWQDPKTLREEAPGTFAATFGCSGDHVTGFDYYLEATLPGGTKQKAGSANAPFQVR